MLNNTCRLCMSDKELLSVFAETSPKNLQTVVHIMTGVMICKTDFISQKICSNCSKLLGKMYEFRQQAQRADRYLKEKYKSKNMLPYSWYIIKTDNKNTKMDKTDSIIKGSSNIGTENISDQTEKLTISTTELMNPETENKTIVNNDNVTDIEPVTKKVKSNSTDGISSSSNLPANVTTECKLKDNKSRENIHSIRKLFRKDVPISNRSIHQSVKNIFASYPNIKLHPVCVTLNMDPTVCMELNAVENYFLKNKLDIKESIKLATKSERTKQFDNTVYKRKIESYTLEKSEINNKRKKICGESIEIITVQSVPSSINNLLPHSCNVCNSPQFSQKSLALHYKIHFKCIYCSKIFREIEIKTIHEKSCLVKKVLESKPNTTSIIKSNLVNTESSISPKSQEVTIPPPSTNIPQENSSIIKPAVFITDSSILNSLNIPIDERSALKLLFKKQCHRIVQTNNPFENIEIERNNRSAVFNNLRSHLVNSKIPVYIKTGDYNVKITEINPQYPKQKQPWNTTKKIDFRKHKSSKLNSFSHYIRNGLPLLQTNTVNQSMEINRPTGSSRDFVTNNSVNILHQEKSQTICKPVQIEDNSLIRVQNISQSTNVVSPKNKTQPSIVFEKSLLPSDIFHQEKSQTISKPVQIEDNSLIRVQNISQSTNVVSPQNKTQPSILFEKSLLQSNSGCFSGTNPKLDPVIGTIQLNTKLNGNIIVQKSCTQNLPKISSQNEFPISTSLLVNKNQSSNETIIIPDDDPPQKVDVDKKFTNKYVLINTVLPNRLQKKPIANSPFGANSQIRIKINNSNTTPLQSGSTVNNTPLQSDSQVYSTTPIISTIVKNNNIPPQIGPKVNNIKILTQEDLKKNNNLIGKSLPQNPNPFIINFTLPYHNLPSNNTLQNNYSISLPIKQPQNSLREQVTHNFVNVTKLDSNLPIPNNLGTNSTNSNNMVPSSNCIQIPTTSATISTETKTVQDGSCSSISASTVSTNIDTHNSDRPVIRVRNLCELK